MERKYTEQIFIKMCSYIPTLKRYKTLTGIERRLKKYEQWYLKFSWTTIQEEEFIKWLTQYFYDNAYKMNLVKNKRLCAESARWFVLNYGWTINDKNIQTQNKRVGTER